VEKIHHTWSFGSDATVLDDYALTTTTRIDVLSTSEVFDLALTARLRSA